MLVLPKHKEKNRGSVTVIGLIIVLFFIIMLAAIMPMTNTDAKISLMNRDNIQAQLAAEAGAKAAIAGLMQSGTNWAWIQNYPDNRQVFSSTSTAKYAVKLEPNITDGSKPISNRTYVVTSLGQVGDAKKKVSVCYDVPASGAIENSAVYIAGSLTYDQHLNITGDIISGGAAPVGIEGSGNWQWGVDVSKLLFPAYDYTAFRADAQPLPTFVTNGNTILTGTKYYSDTSIVLDNKILGNNSTITALNPTVIFVNGDIDMPVNGLVLSGKIMLIATGHIDIGENNNTNFKDTVLVSLASVAQGGYISFKNNSVIMGLIIGKGDLDFKNNTAVSADPTLADTFNEIMGGYDLNDPSSYAPSGTTVPYNWKLE